MSDKSTWLVAMVQQVVSSKIRWLVPIQSFSDGKVNNFVKRESAMIF